MADRAPRRARWGPSVSSTAILVALLVRLGPPSALAAAPQERVRQTLDAVSAVLNDPELQGSAKERDRRERVGKVMRDSFDFRAMARESLGSHWASLSAEQQDEFVGLFGQLFERSYNRLVLRFLGDSATTYGAESIEKAAPSCVRPSSARTPTSCPWTTASSPRWGSGRAPTWPSLASAWPGTFAL